MLYGVKSYKKYFQTPIDFSVNLYYKLIKEILMKVVQKIIFLLFLCLFVSTVSGESLEERVEALETKVQALLELVEELMQELSLRDTPSETNTASQNGQLPDAIANKRNSSNVISMSLVELSFTESNAANDYANDYSDWLTFAFVFKSNLEKPTRAVKGNVVFSDLFGDEWWNISLTLSDPLLPNEPLPWIGTINYNMFTDEHKTAKNTQAKDVIVVFEVAAIIYEDGTKENF